MDGISCVYVCARVAYYIYYYMRGIILKIIIQIIQTTKLLILFGSKKYQTY